MTEGQTLIAQARSLPSEVDRKAGKDLKGSTIGYAMDGFDLLVLGFLLGELP